MGPGFNAVCVGRERSSNYKSHPPSHGSVRRGGGRQKGGDKKGERRRRRYPELSDEISSAQGLVLGLSFHRTNAQVLRRALVKGLHKHYIGPDWAWTQANQTGKTGRKGKIQCGFLTSGKHFQTFSVCRVLKDIF